LSSVQKARRLEGEKKGRKIHGISPPTTTSDGLTKQTTTVGALPQNWATTG